MNQLYARQLCLASLKVRNYITGLRGLQWKEWRNHISGCMGTTGCFIFKLPARYNHGIDETPRGGGIKFTAKHTLGRRAVNICVPLLLSPPSAERASVVHPSSPLSM